MTLNKVYQLKLGSILLDAHLDPDHELVILADEIDWERIADELSEYFSNYGRAAKSIRLMVGAHILKHRYNVSDAQVVQTLKENLYWRYFCGLDGALVDWQLNDVLNSSTMTKFRNRIGAGGVRKVQAVVNGQLFKERRISAKTEIVDSTAMEKNILFPVDGVLLDKGRKRIVKTIRRLNKLGIEVKTRSFKRQAKKQAILMAKLGRGRRQRLQEGTNKMLSYAKEVMKQVPKVLEANPNTVKKKNQREVRRLKEHLELDSQLLERVMLQTEMRLQGTHIKGKVYSFHAPEVVVIAKGKRGKRYEFGCKVSLSMDRNGYIAGHQVYHENIADVKSLDEAIANWETTLGEPPKELATDRGYSTKRISDQVSKVKVVSMPARGPKPHPDRHKAYFKRLQRKRCQIECVISHLKTDHRMNKCRYKGKQGDHINVGLATLAWNTKKWTKDLKAERRKAA